MAAWEKVNLKKWANEMGVDLKEINEKLRLRQLIINRRQELSLTQGDVAKKVGISRSRIAQIENGVKIHKMSFDVLFRVLQTLGYNYRVSTKKIAT